MAVKFTKKKIAGTLLLVAIIVFFACGGHKLVASAAKSLFGGNADSSKKVLRPEDLVVDQKLVARLDSFVKNTKTKGEVGIYVYDQTLNKTIYGYRADSLMRPASNMKMVTCMAAIRKFGTRYRVSSEAYMNGTMKQDTLVGNIAYKFTFDPWFTPDSLAKLTNAFYKRGVRAIKGKVILDLAMTEQMEHEEHWIPGDLATRKLGILFRGEERLRGNIMHVMDSLGIECNWSQIVVAKVPKGAKLVEKTSSPIFKSIYKAIRNSNNEYAESLSFLLGAPYAKDGDYRQGATVALREFIQKELNMRPDAVSVIHDGSGLCIYDRLTPRFLVQLLHYTYAHRYIQKEVMVCMPISGVRGTLHQRMTTPDVYGKVWAKTGTLTREKGITSLSGFVKGKNGHQILFSIIQNGASVYGAREWQDKFCQELVK